MINKTIVIDCSGLCYSFAYTLDVLTVEEYKTGVVYGFLNKLRYLAKVFMSTDFVFCWDEKGSIREEMFPEYKEKRKKKRKEDPVMDQIYQAIFSQMKALKGDILPRLGFENSFGKDGFEADDFIASIVHGYENCVIISSDDDMLQLLGYADIFRKELITNDKFVEEWGIHPSQWSLVKALAGCKTDEVPGIPGVGEKTAAKYLAETLPKYCADGKTIRKDYQKVVDGYSEYMERNMPLVDLPLKGTPEVELKEHKKILNIDAFWDICEEYEFKSYMHGNEKIKWEMFFRGDPI